MGIFIGIVLVILVGIVCYRAGKVALRFYRLMHRAGKSIDRYIESE
jgi:hypothetical protein